MDFSLAKNEATISQLLKAKMAYEWQKEKNENGANFSATLKVF